MKFCWLLKFREARVVLGATAFAGGSIILCAALAGCASTALAKNATTLSAALAPVVDQSAAAYRDAVALHDLRADYEAVVAYENKDASYNPRNVPVLMSQKDIQARLSVLAALQVYSESLIEITRGNNSPELDAAWDCRGSGVDDHDNRHHGLGLEQLHQFVFVIDACRRTIAGG